MNPLRWLFNRTETRAHAAGVSQVYIDGKRRSAQSEGQASLSASLGLCAGVWSRSFAQLVPEPSDVLTPDILGCIGSDLFWRGQSTWQIRLDGSRITLHRAAFWDQYNGGRWNLTIPQPNGTDTVRCLDDEVLSLRINSAPDTPWLGRSPLSFMGISPSLMADVESTLAGSLPYVGKGLLPVPSTIPEEQKNAALAGLRGGSSLVAVTSKEEIGHHTGGVRAEFKRVDLTPDLSKAGLPEVGRDVHARILAAAGIPPSLYDAGGNAGALRETYRLFVLGTLDPLSRMITPELSKIGVSRLGMQDLMTADVAGRARAVSSLVQSGVPLATAMALSGWDNVPLPAGASVPIPHGGE